MSSTSPIDATLDCDLGNLEANISHLLLCTLKNFLNHFYFVAGCIILLNEAAPIREYHEQVYMVCNIAYR